MRHDNVCPRRPGGEEVTGVDLITAARESWAKRGDSVIEDADVARVSPLDIGDKSTAANDEVEGM